MHESYYGGYTDTTTLHVASAGKWIASATIAAVVDEGLLSWNDKVNKYLPQFTDSKGEATLRQLFSHTAGYPDYQPEGQRCDNYQTLEESVAHIVNLHADTLPGTKFRYGGLAMQVAGRMAEIASGKNWEALFQEKIAIPLDMSRSHFTPVSEEPGFNPMLGGGFRTCLHDYMQFLKMISDKGIYDGRRILSSKVLEEMEADQIKDICAPANEYVFTTRQNTHNSIYGLGIWREELDENGRATLISSPGWAGAYPWVDRKHNIYGFIIAKVNEEKAKAEGFSSFLNSAVLPLVVRDAIIQKNSTSDLKRGKVSVGNAELYYEEMGQGQPVILLHGHSLNHTMWDQQFSELAKQYRTIRYDMRGYGYSSPQEEGVQFTHVEDLIKMMDAFHIDRAHIVGLSLGGYVGTDMLGWFPERIETAILASGNIRPNPKPSIPMDELEIRKRNDEIIAVKRKGIETMKREWFNGLICSGGSNSDNIRKPLWNMIYQWDAWQPLHKEPRVTAGEDAYSILKENLPRVPVLIVEGKSEHNFFSSHPELLNYLPQGTLAIIENAGHLVNMEQPEEFNKIMLDFIDVSNSKKVN